MSDRGVVLHYRVLKQFLDISDDANSRSKSNSSRAARAREKLLKLSEAQFKELSTDVYDELKRRIDESRGEPDYLLPKSSFHPKRNQARQKLSSLPQSRFKDLVSDISYEIERRNLHIGPKNESVATAISGVDSLAAQQSYPHSHHSPTQQRFNSSAKNDELVKESPDLERHENFASNTSNLSQSSDLLNKTIGISSKEIVVTKANLTWSSDEENESMAETPVLKQKSLQQSLQQDSSESNNALKSQLTHQASELEELKSNYNKLQADYDALKAEHDQIKLDHDDSLTKSIGLENEVSQLRSEKEELMVLNRNLEAHRSEYINLTKEYEDLKASNASLRLENQSLKNTSPKGHSRSNSAFSLPKDSNAFSSAGVAAGVAAGAIGGAVGHAALTGTSKTGKSSLQTPELETILQKLAVLDSKSEEEKKPLVSQLRKESAIWQKKYEDLLASRSVKDFSKNLKTDQQLNNLVSPEGLVSLKAITSFQASVESFFGFISEKDASSDSLFQMISRICILANDIAMESESAQANNESATSVREAASHALTTTRYFVTYSSVLPKVVVERALSELAFTVCDLAGHYKISPGSSNLKGSYTPSAETSRVIEEDNSSIGVKPLRMAQKLMSSSQTSLEQQQPRAQTPSPNTANESNTAPSTRELRTSPRAKAINSLASKFENSKSSVDADIPKSKVATTPTRSNILDRVKHFESPPSEDGKAYRRSLSPEDDSARRFLVNRSLASEAKNGSDVNAKEAAILSTGAAAGALTGVGAATVAGTESKSRGIFQSLRDRLGYDTKNEAGQEEISDNHDSSNDNIQTSTAETTPSREEVVPPQTNHQLSYKSEAALPYNSEKLASDDTIVQDEPTSKLNVTTQQVKLANVNGAKFPKSTAAKKVVIADVNSDEQEEKSEEDDDERTTQAKQRQEYRKSMAAATFNVDLFDIDDPDNTLTQVLLYLEHQTVQVITTIQVLLSAIKKPNATRDDLREKSLAITEVISQMTDATNTSMNQTRNAQLKEHGSWVVKSLEDCYHRMNILCRPTSDKQDAAFADRSFKQRLAGISFDIAKCTKELVKTVEEASLKEDIAGLDARLSHSEDLT